MLPDASYVRLTDSSAFTSQTRCAAGENTTRLPVPESSGSASDSIALTAGCADSASADSAGFSLAGTTTGSIRAVEMAAVDTTSADAGGLVTVDKMAREPIATRTVKQDVAASKPIRL